MPALPGWPSLLEALKKATESFITKAEKQDSPRDDEINIQDLPKLLADAKKILGSFLVTDSDEPIDIQKLSPVIQKDKNVVRRLLTYAKLRKVIEDKSLKHVRLPKKHLYIKDIASKKYLRGKPAVDILDSIVKLIAISTEPLRVKIDSVSPQKC